jgi:hypothetical protein
VVVVVNFVFLSQMTVGDCSGALDDGIDVLHG